MNRTRRERITAVLTEHPDGVPTPLIAKLAGENMANRQRALSKCGEMLREMETRGEVVRVPAPGPGIEWCLVPTRLRRLCGAIGKATAAWNSLPPQEWAALGFTEEGWQKFISHYQAVARRELARS